MEERLDEEINNKKHNKKSEIFEVNELEILLSFIKEQINKKENNDYNILYKFISEPNILENESFLILFIKELENHLKLGNNILIPFSNIYPNLIKAYIDSDLDEENNFEYIEKIFFQYMNIFRIYIMI